MAIGQKIGSYLKEHRHFLLLLLAGLILRLACLGFYVPLCNQDELSNLYDAVSFVETGKDRWETPTCIVFRGFGSPDYRPPFFIWLGALIYHFFGLDENGIRLISLFFSILGLVFGYLLVKELFEKRIALLFLFLLVFSPLHIIFSSIGFESSSMSSAICIAGLYFFLRYYRQPRWEWLSISIVLIASCVNIYQSYKLTSLLFILLILAYILYTQAYRHFMLACGLALIAVLPQVILMYQHPDLLFARAQATVHLSSNMLIYLREFLLSFNPLIWFYSINENINLANIRLLLIEFPFFIYGFYLIFFARKNGIHNFQKVVIGSIIVISMIPEVITISSVQLYRNNLSGYYMVLIIALGFDKFIREYLSHKLCRIILYGLFLINFSLFFYLGYHAPARKIAFQPELVKLYKKLNQYKNSYDSIILEDYGNQPYIYLIYYCKISPKEFQSMKKTKQIGENQWDHITQVDKYVFESKEKIVSQNMRTHQLIVCSQPDRKDDIKIDSVLEGNFKMYFYQMRHGISYKALE